MLTPGICAYTKGLFGLDGEEDRRQSGEGRSVYKVMESKEGSPWVINVKEARGLGRNSIPGQN